jgi:FkbM family methyltransferase
MPIEETWLTDVVGSAIGALKNRELAIDVGANKGDWTIELADTFDKVIAVEPDRRNPLADKVDDLDSVEVVWGALWFEPGEVVLYKRPSPDQNSLLEHHPIGAGACGAAPVIEKEIVPGYTLPGVAPNGADFVKIDVEGAEAEILSACDEDSGIWNRTVFVVECHDTFDDVSAHLVRLGKTVVRVPHPSVSAHRCHCWAIGLPS